MKKNYQKPEAEYIHLSVQDVVANGPVGGEWGSEEMPDDW